MNIYIVRHAIAEEKSSSGNDAARVLASEGKRKMKEAALGFARLEPEIEKIFSSPLVRALQTAQIIASPLKKKVEELEELAPGRSPQEVLARLVKMRDIGSVMLAGHEPNCSELAAYLLGNSTHLEIEFKKGAICLIQMQSLTPGSGILIWHLSPQVLRLMAR